MSTQPERAKFEAWVSASPFEKDIGRNSTDPQESAWPGQYREIDVQLAWEAWQAALATPERECMSWADYQEFIIAGWRAKGTFPDNLTDADVAVAALGLAGEAGEAAEHVKKLLRADPGYLLPRMAFARELGDVLAYVAANCSIHGFRLEDVMRWNVEKLTERRAALAATPVEPMTDEEANAQASKS